MGEDRGKNLRVSTCARRAAHARHARDRAETLVARWISGDWGYSHPAAVYWHAQDGDRTVTYRGLHGSGIGEVELGKRIVELSTGERIDAFYFSPDAFSKRTSANTIAEQVGQGLSGSGIPFPAQADNDRLDGARLCYNVLKAIESL